MAWLDDSLCYSPGLNNWVLFAAEIETVLKKYDKSYDSYTVISSFGLIDSWYVGDGWYMDGPTYAFDYYNSLVIHPMMIDLCRNFPELLTEEQYEKIIRRASRHVKILERLISPDGTFIAVGRSISYRCGVFHLLAMAALENLIPTDMPLGGVRASLGAVIRSTLSKNSYREDGFLHIGLCGSQPQLGETYISTGSLYFASTAFLPLGLPESHPFWTTEEVSWTQKRIWLGEDMPADHLMD